jgi:alpha-aminoadipic semialdehyde synthase
LLRDLYSRGERPRLRVIGDISCDIEGSVECTVRATESDDPVYVYEPKTGKTPSGIVGDGPIILAVDHLPCELPVDASVHFSRSLRPLIPGLCETDFTRPLAQSGLPDELARATIVYQGALTERFRYLEEFLDA